MMRKTTWAVVACCSLCFSLLLGLGCATRPGSFKITSPDGPFAAYDTIVIKTVQSHWNKMLYEDKEARILRGKVTVGIKLQPDGTITEVRVTENTGGEKQANLALKAVSDSAPFDPLPQSLSALITNEARDVTLSFYY
jgi:TonB family protein